MWSSQTNFLVFVKHVWNRPNYGSGLVKLARKLKFSNITLKNWNTEVFARVDQNIRDLKAQLVELEKQLQSGYVKEIEEVYLTTKCELAYWEKREKTGLTN